MIPDYSDYIDDEFEPEYKPSPEDTNATNILFLNLFINADTLQYRNELLETFRKNVLNISGRLRYAYLTDKEALQRGINLSALQKLRKVRNKVEEIYTGLKGYKSSIVKAILTGIGNGYNNYVPVVSYNDPVYADQSEYDVLHRSYSSGDVDNYSKRVTDLLRAIANALKHITGFFETDSASEAMFQSESGQERNSNTVKSNNQKTVTLSDVPPQGEFVTGEESQHEKQKTTSVVVPPKEDKNFFEQTTDWIIENPIPSLLIGGTLFGGGILIKKYFDEQKANERGGLQGLKQKNRRLRK